MQRCALRATSTFDEHGKHWTFKCNLSGQFKTLDHFLTHVRLSERIIDVKRIVGGPASDHNPIILKLQFKQKRRGIAPPKRTKMRI